MMAPTVHCDDNPGALNGMCVCMVLLADMPLVTLSWLNCLQLNWHGVRL